MKAKLMKRLMALAMMATMAVSTTAFAAEGEDEGGMATGDDGYPTQELEVTGELADAIIKITFPTEPTVIINPYGMDVNITEKVTSNAQVLSPSYGLTNESNVDLAVTLTAVGAVSGEATLAAAPDDIGEDETDKKVFMYVEMAECTKPDGSDAVWAAEYSADADNQLAVADSAQDPAVEILKLPKAEYKAGALYKAKYAAFKLGGNATTNPTSAWAESDTVAVTLTFSFKPTTIEAEAGE